MLFILLQKIADNVEWHLNYYKEQKEITLYRFRQL